MVYFFYISISNLSNLLKNMHVIRYSISYVWQLYSYILWLKDCIFNTWNSISKHQQTNKKLNSIHIPIFRKNELECVFYILSTWLNKIIHIGDLFLYWIYQMVYWCFQIHFYSQCLFWVNCTLIYFDKLRSSILLLVSY